MFRHSHFSKGWRILVSSVCLVVFLLATVNAQVFAAPADQDGAGGPVKLIIDTDPGVDDAAAIVWLFSQTRYPVDVLGIVTVAGNTTDVPIDPQTIIPGVYFSTNNVLTLLDALEENYIPSEEGYVQVVMGANEPLGNQPNSLASAMLHGPDGLWGVSFTHPHDIDGLIYQGAIRMDAPQYYCDMAVAHPGATVLALGPLTNLAQAAQTCPDDMKNFGQIVVLGGSQAARAPQSDYNLWQDAVAAEIVLMTGLPVTLVAGEASGQFTLREVHLRVLARTGNAATQLLVTPADPTNPYIPLGPMQMYAEAQTGLGGETAVAYYDVAAAIYAASADNRLSLGTAQSALVRVVTEGLLEGQTVMGFTFADRIMMILSAQELNEMIILYGNDPDTFFYMLAQLLYQNPDNAQVVLDIREQVMRAMFMQGMR